MSDLTLTVEDLLLLAFKDVKKAELEVNTIPKMRKRGNALFGRVRKISRIVAKVGPWNYTHEVNVQRIQEGKHADFQPADRKWGTRVAGTPFVEHRGNKYVECNVLDVLSTEYVVDDRLATEAEMDEIQSFLSAKSTTSRQGVDAPVIVRDYKVSSVTRIKEAN